MPRSSKRKKSTSGQNSGNNEISSSKPTINVEAHSKPTMGKVASGNTLVNGDVSYETLGSLVDIFRRQAEETPDNLVLLTEGYTPWTIKELDKVTDQLAVHFVDKFGAVRGRSIGIFMDKCAEYIISYIAALKCGCGYMPLDVSYPRNLLESILEEARPAVVCTKPQYQHTLLGVTKALFSFDHTWNNKIAGVDTDNIGHKLPTVTLDDLAYIVYSSGTTGKPKGIQCPVRGAVLSYNWRWVHYPFQPDDRVACNVFFVWELLRPILKGIPMYVIPDDVIYDPPKLCDYISRNEITRVLFTPSLLQAVLDTQKEDYVQKCLAQMRIIWLCGEVVTVGLVGRVVEDLPHVKLLNLYSVSECHDVAVCDLSQWYREIDEQERKHRQYAPVGRKFDEVHVAVLDEKFSVLPIGMSGEIYVGGPTLAIGYLNRPELDKKRFIDTPAELKAKYGPRLYKTGDWGYLMSDGSLEICGRCDTMVKVRGYSIEIPAIENTLTQLPYVHNCAVVALGKEGEDKQLAAYIVLAQDVHKSKKDLRSALKMRLPFYMIPTYFIVMDKLPMLPASSKVDKKALPPLDLEHDAVEPEALPQTDTEKKLAKIWMEILGLKTLDIQDSFFDMGGHSLLAARLLHRIREDFGVNLAVRDLFVNPTVTLFSRLLDEDQRSATPTPRLDLEEEVDKHDLKNNVMDLSLRAFWRSIKLQEDRLTRGTAFVTGVTGFVGSAILRQLLKLTKVQVMCLIREAANVTAEQRLRDSLKHFHLLDEEMEQWLDSRVTVVKGDVALVQFGLTDEDYQFVSYEADFVIHAAAYVNLVYPYQALHGVNVLGTQNVLMFTYANKIKPLHYISTDAVFPWPGDGDVIDEATDMRELWERIPDGYGQSKWVAEQLIMRALKRGLPAFIYRLGNQAADSQLGWWNPSDFTYLMLYGSCATNTAPEIDWPMEMTPVDFTARLIVTVATQRFRNEVGKVFHLINTSPPKLDEVAEWMRNFGYDLKSASLQEWNNSIQKALSLSDANPKLRLLDRLLETWVRDEQFFQQQASCSRHNTEALLANLGWEYPALDEVLVKRWLKRMVMEGQLPRPTGLSAQPLVGRVVVVTGASGGIGEAIAYHLSVDGGAKTVLCARRINKLKDLCERIKAAHGEAIAVQCDVTDKEQTKAAIDKAILEYGRVDILINNAGIMYYQKMENVNVDEWQHQINLNCTGTMNCIGAVLPHFVQRKSGHIINISSDAGKRAFAGLAVYCGTKFFIEGMSTALREEMAPHNVKVTTIQPGDVATELASRSTDAEARQQYDGSLQAHKVLEPDDIASAVMFAARQPPHCAVNEILVEPTAAPI